MSYDFIDLDEKDFYSSIFTPKNDPSHSSPPSLSHSAVFIRSTSTIQNDDRESVQRQAVPLTATNDTVEFILNMPSDTKTVLSFNPNGHNCEGRDSKVFPGTLNLHGQSLQVAIKVCKNEPSAIEGAQNEIKIAQEILNGHANFLKFYHSGSLTIQAEECFVSIWEWIEGGTLDQVVSQLSRTQISSFIKTMAVLLNFLHSTPLAHHDIKPQNILITTDAKRLLLIDFGDSKHVSPNSALLPLDEGIGLGTLSYTAPELLSRKSDSYDPLAADVYSFGVLLFYLLNHGKILPFSALIPHRAVQLILTVQKGFFASGYNPESPRSSPLFPLMLDCLQVDPAKRPRAAQILDLVNRIIND